MLYVVVNTKGGVGKSTLSNHVMPIILKSNFNIVEVDNNNDSTTTFYNSDLLKDKISSIDLSQADNILDDILFDLLTQDIDYVLDAGGGDDSIKILELLKSQSQENIKYIVPITSTTKQKNILDTLKNIDKDNTLFILNGVHINVKEEFLYYFGSDSFDIESTVKNLNNPKYITISFSHLFAIAENYGMTVSDLAAFSQGLSPEDSSAQFLKESDGDREVFKKLRSQYKTSLKAQELLKEIEESISAIG